MNGQQMGLQFDAVFATIPRDFVPAGCTRPAARITDPVTSHEAAAIAHRGASHGRRLVLAALALRPMTDFELAAHTGWQQTSIGKRRGECVTAGLVEVLTDDKGNKVKRPSPSGSPALVWALTEKGRVQE